MHFNLKIVPAEDELTFQPDSALVKFFIDTKNLEKLAEGFFESLNFPLGRAQKKNFLNEKNNELVYFSHDAEPSVVFLRKIKLDENFSVDFFRNYFAGLIPSLQNHNLENVHVVVPYYKEFEKYFESEEYFLQTIFEGMLLGNYTFDKYKSETKKPGTVSLFIHYTDQKLLKRAIDVTGKLMSAIYFSRDLVNEPANNLYPMELAARVKAEFKNTGVKVNVLEAAELKRKKMFSILAVGGGSNKQPCLISLHYKPAGRAKKKIALVGKGVTYDSGGLSIKPTSGMLEMKADMAGGAAVAGIIKTAAVLKLPVEIVGVIPAVENMIGGASFKPSDVIKSYSGKTIEVKDTDAEGRIILADALHYASEQKPDEIIDLATLTGACVVALGEIAAGLFTSSDKLAGALLNSGAKTFERLWRFPFWSEYKDMIKSDIADVANLGPRWGGAITAGKFLEHFVDEKIPWAHLDIAGPAIKHKSTNYTEKYDTGFGVRLIADYLVNGIK